MAATAAPVRSTVLIGGTRRSTRGLGAATGGPAAGHPVNRLPCPSILKRFTAAAQAPEAGHLAPRTHLATKPSGGTHGDPEEMLGDSVTAEGVVTRRHTLGRKLTFVDVTCAGRSRAAVGTVEEGTNPRDPSSEDHFVFLKCWGVVPKLVRPGATIRFTGRILKQQREREMQAAHLRPDSYYVSVPEEDIKVSAATPAAAIPNARAFTASDAESGDGHWGPSGRFDENTPSSATEILGASGGGGGQAVRCGGPIALRRAAKKGGSVAQLCKSLIVRGACGDPNCTKRHLTSDEELEQVRRSKRDAIRRSKAAVAHEFDPDDPHRSDTKASKQHSDRIFADWIVQTFRLNSSEDPVVAAAAGMLDDRKARRARSEETIPDEDGAVKSKAGVQREEDGNGRGRTQDRTEVGCSDVYASNGGGIGGGEGATDAGDRDSGYSGGGVADIAGGGGVLSFELHVRHGIPCTLVDPRHVSLSPRQLNTWRNLRKRGAMAGKGSAEWSAWLRAEQWVRIAATEDELRQRQHLERVLANTDAATSWVSTESGHPGGGTLGAEESGSSRVGDGGGMSATNAGEIHTATNRRLVTAVSSPSSPPSPHDTEAGVGALFTHVPSEFWGDVDGPVGAQVATCDVLVGMHPDQATEPIVDAALALGKPFAIVPCCVFPELFPQRRTKDGAPVRTYIEFLDYLMRKDPEIKMDYLPFKGRNRVLYHLGRARD